MRGGAFWSVSLVFLKGADVRVVVVYKVMLCKPSGEYPETHIYILINLVLFWKDGSRSDTRMMVYSSNCWYKVIASLFRQDSYRIC